jgi:hypothetical protein
MRQSLFILCSALLLWTSTASAQCAGGQVAGGSCDGVPASGCCDWEYEGFSDLYYWCEAGTLCVRDCEQEGGWGGWSCGWSDTQFTWTCGDTFDVSYVDDDFNFGQCGTNMGTGTDPGTGTETPGTGTGMACGDVSYAGCCDGSTLTWCEGGEIRIIDCTQNAEAPGCGWSDEAGFYDCSAYPYPDPSGMNPLNCDGSGGTVTPGGCGSVSYEGCCSGQTLYYCESGSLETLDCGEAPFCGWNADSNYFGCGTPGSGDPSGYHPLNCDGTPGTGTTGPCTPDCFGKACGSDGCGGTCGSCAIGMECFSGQCKPSEQCTPTCKRPDDTLKECGDNGCGGMCGSCGVDLACNAEGVCVAPEDAGCVPECGSHECGPDGCGEVCGSCEEGYGCYDGYCVFGMECQPACDGAQCGPDGCGAECGTCGEGSICEGITCVEGETGPEVVKPDENGECPPGQFLYYGVCVAEDEEGSFPNPNVNAAVDDGTAKSSSGCAVTRTATPASALLLLIALSALLATRRRILA